MIKNRNEIACRTARKLRTANIHELHSVIGFDGFVDEILTVVDQRVSATDYVPIQTIAQLGAKISAAAGQSSNYELVVQRVKLGGNGPIMANALGHLGTPLVYIGSVGQPDEPAHLHPVFASLAQLGEVLVISGAGHTDALEFTDGKLMLGKIGAMSDMNWANLLRQVGLDRLIALYENAGLIGMVNWTMLPNLSEVFTNLQRQVWPKLSARRRVVFVDLADPEKRRREDLKAVLESLQHFAPAEVVLGVNFKEAQQVCAVLGLSLPDESAEHSAAADIRNQLGLSAVVIHPRASAGCATAAGAWRYQGPFVAQPKISTGAGDHFNAGFALGYALGFAPEECLASGVAASGYYVREAASPTAQQLAGFLDALPAPQV